MITKLVPYPGGLTAVFLPGSQSLEDDRKFLEELEEKLQLPAPAERDLDVEQLGDEYLIIPLDQFLAEKAMINEIAQT